MGEVRVEMAPANAFVVLHLGGVGHNSIDADLTHGRRDRVALQLAMERGAR